MSAENNKRKIQVALAAVVGLIILLLLVRNMGGDGKSSVSIETNSSLTETEHLNSIKQLLAEKTERIKELKENNLADAGTITQLEGEVKELRDSVLIIQDELDIATSAGDFQQIKRRTTEIARRANEWSEQTDRTITRSAGEKLRAIQQNLEKVDAKYARDLAEQEQKIKALVIEKANAAFSPNAKKEIEKLEARIRELEEELAKLRLENVILRKQNDSLQVENLRAKGETARADALAAELKVRDNTIANLDKRLQTAQSIVNKIGGLELYFIDNQGRKITTDKASKAKDLHALRINFAQIGVSDGEVIIDIKSNSPMGESIMDLQRKGRIKSHILTPHIDIEGDKRKLLPKGKYCVIISDALTNTQIDAPKYFEVHSGW